MRDTVSQCGVKMSGAAVSLGIAGVRGAEADCGRDCYTWRLVCESDGKRLPPQALTLPGDTAARPQPAGSAHITGVMAASSGQNEKYTKRTAPNLVMTLVNHAISVVYSFFLIA